MPPLVVTGLAYHRANPREGAPLLPLGWQQDGTAWRRVGEIWASRSA